MASTSNAALEAATATLDQALSCMRAQRVPATAENIMVWYHYIEQDIPKLNAEVDRLLAEGGVFSIAVSAQLYERFFIEMDRRKVELLQVALRKLIECVSGYIRSLNDDVSDYQQALMACVESLSSDCNPRDLVSVIESTLEKTRHALECNITTKAQIDDLNNEIIQLKTSLSQLERTALEDALTAVSNRRAFDQVFPQMLDKDRNSVNGCCLLLLDVDNFKMFNDRHGHQVGDKVLRFVASMLKNVSKGQDFVARYGGEEFAIVLPDTAYSGGMALASSMCKTIAKARLTIDAKNGVIDNVTVSVGVAWVKQNDTPEEMFKRADTCLLRAKAEGRNRVFGQSDLSG